MIRSLLSKNLVLKYKIKKFQRKSFIRKMKKKNLYELMEYDADLFEKRHGYRLDWNNLSTYSEKMQWAKIFDKDPRKVLCTDKFEVRKWVSKKIGEDYLIPLIGTWDNAKNIDFNLLPNKCVLKTNCSSGDVIIIKNKNKLTNKEIRGYKEKLNYYLEMKFGFNTCEVHYNKIKPKIIAERFIESPHDDLQDYKFLCFDGKPYFCWVDVGRYHDHKRNVYDLDWKLQNWHQFNYGTTDKPIKKPENFEKMVKLAEILASDFKHVRVDFYNVDGKIYFGEMTFTNSSGFERIEPQEADLMLGNLWNIDTNI